MKKFFGLAAFITLSLSGFGQITADEDIAGRDGSRIISTAVPFLTISPDARAGGMADIGVATTPDALSSYWNPAKLVFIKNTKGDQDLKMGASLSYTPWLRKLINDMSLNHLTGYYKRNQEEAFGLSMTYFDLGDITFRNESNQVTGEHRPREFSLNGVYSRKLSNNLSVGIGAKFIHSNLTGDLTLDDGSTTKPGNTAAADVSVYYTKEVRGLATKLGLYNGNVAFGANISNIGAKISYSSDDAADFIPTNLRVGWSATGEIDPYNRITFAMDLNKLMVPSPPVYETDSLGNTTSTIASGKDPDRGFLSGIFGSFSDAPDGIGEELKEFTMAFGAEYWYANAFAARAGFFSENALKGNRKYFTLGIGVNYNSFGVDMSYLVPIRQNNPLQDTLRFTLIFEIPETTPQTSISDDSSQ